MVLYPCCRFCPSSQTLRSHDGKGPQSRQEPGQGKGSFGRTPTTPTRRTSTSRSPAHTPAGGPDPGGARPRGGGDRRRRYGGVVVEVPRTRPEHMEDKKGTSGTPVSMVTNFCKVKTQTDRVLFQYQVEFSPDVDNRKARIAMVYSQEDLLGDTKIFDGKILFLPKKLENDKTVFTTERKTDGATITITITLTNEVPPTSPVCLQIYNILFRKFLKNIGMQRVNRSHHNPTQKIDMKAHGLEVWPGFVTSILQYEANVMLMADVSHKILRSDTVLSFMYELYGQVDPERFYEICSGKLVGEIALTRYNNKTYRIDGISWEEHPTDKFSLPDGTEISFVEYYEKQYNRKIQDNKQPLLLSRAKKKTKDGKVLILKLIPELCSLTGLSDEIRQNFSVMKDLASHTRLGPGDSSKAQQGFISQLNSNPDVQKEMKGWQIEFDQNLLQLDGRTLPAEKLFYFFAWFAFQFSYDRSAEWSREFRGKTLLSTRPLKDWLLIFTKRDAQIANDFKQTLEKVAGPIGIQVSNPVMVDIEDDQLGTYLRVMKEQVKAGVTQMVVCIVPNNRKDRYDAIKKFCCVDQPLPCQVIMSRTLSKKQMLMSVCTKIGLQMNCKMGGELWALEIPLPSLMVVGINMYPDSLTKGTSVGGFVASMNRNLTRWYSKCTIHKTGQELIDQLKHCLAASLRNYQTINQELPQRVIFYRDGVADWQLEALLKEELPQIVDTLKSHAEGYEPKITFVIVNKRINTRFFARDGSGLQNPPPGTVVDDEVTRPEWYDFFLVSTSVRQGTVTPCHYNVVWDTSGLKPDQMQKLTYKLCHLYYNWQGTIRVPAPCQYAHKLAFLVGQSVHTKPSEDLAQTLFYL
ncbi:PREDICTED: piwi-like protein 1 [Branchiostoma belcheri]|uniref:Piwi-like protein 1 n=1 Tax=Branchiostoma belcheri TaxID=7741 RepID=A0A6P4YPW2_BRABE|nr:PREDICTED: piwi-like protein 1 [Branchiostoma belcheri]